MRFSKLFALILIAAGSFSFSSASQDDSIFAVPEILKPNVAFWKKMYTDYSVTEGVIHDAIFPNVIFKALAGDPPASKIRKEKASIERSIKTIATRPESTWTDCERAIVALYDSVADTTAFSCAADRIRFQRGEKERFIEGIERSGLYLDTIRSIFRAYGIPERVAYLPYVESGYNTGAYSRVGAAGLWQFMRRTAKIFGMKVNYTIDERRDPVRATLAAAQYLSQAYTELGSWPLAITSYNYGLDGMKRAVAQTGSNDIGVILKKYSGRSFQFASRNFYACFLAVTALAENRASIFPTTQPLAPYRVVDVRTDYFTAPSVICRYLKIAPDQLAALNPAIRPVIFSRDRQLPRDLVLHLPADASAEAVKNAFSAVHDSLKPGDLQRARPAVTAAAVTAAEPPRAGTSAPAASRPTAPAVPAEPQSQKAAAGFDTSLYHLDAAPASDWKTAEIRVSTDETMGHYCEWLNVSAAEIRELNRAGGALRIGARLRIPLRQKSSLDSFNTLRLEYHLAIEEDFYTQYKVAEVRPYAIARGDNIWTLCNEGDNPVPLWLLRKLNRRTDLARITPGDTIEMPVIEEKPKS